MHTGQYGVRRTDQLGSVDVLPFRVSPVRDHMRHVRPVRSVCTYVSVGFGSTEQDCPEGRSCEMYYIGLSQTRLWVLLERSPDTDIAQPRSACIPVKGSIASTNAVCQFYYGRSLGIAELYRLRSTLCLTFLSSFTFSTVCRYCARFQ